jgi:hypothetical protein
MRRRGGEGQQEGALTDWFSISTKTSSSSDSSFHKSGTNHSDTHLVINQVKRKLKSPYTLWIAWSLIPSSVSQRSQSEHILMHYRESV